MSHFFLYVHIYKETISVLRQGLFNTLCRSADEKVPPLMSLRVIDFLQSVDIDHESDQILRKLTDFFAFRQNTGVPVAVVDTGQFIPV